MMEYLTKLNIPLYICCVSVLVGFSLDVFDATPKTPAGRSLSNWKPFFFKERQQKEGELGRRGWRASKTHQKKRQNKMRFTICSGQ